MDKVVKLDNLTGILADARTVFVSGCAAEIPELAPVLSEAGSSATVSGIFLPGINRLDYSALTETMRCETYFMTPQLQPALREGRADYCPWRYRDIVCRYQQQLADVAVVMLSPPDHNGRCSFGVASDYAPLVVKNAKLTVGVINHQMPYIQGVNIAVEALDYRVEIDRPLLETRKPAIDKVSMSIAQRIAHYIGDGDTLQLGLGSIPGAVAEVIGDRRGLRIHSGLIESSALDLDRAGALCEQMPIVGGVALGSAEFYHSLHNNQRLDFRSVLETHDLNTLASMESLVAVNGALQVDLLGQVNSNVMPNGFISGPGGLPEFVAGALGSSGGRSIIALNATAQRGETSRIVPRLSGGLPSISAVDADVVISEYGTAELRGKSISQRARAMIEIAAPAHREVLMDAANQAGLLH